MEKIFTWLIGLSLIIGFVDNTMFTHRVMGEYYLSNKNYIKAIPYIKTAGLNNAAFKCTPFFDNLEDCVSDRYVELAINLDISLGREVEALKYSEEVLEQKESNRDANYIVGLNEWKHGNFSTAEHHLRIAANKEIYQEAYSDLLKDIEYASAKKSEEYTKAVVKTIVDVIVPDSPLDLIPLGKIKNVGKMAKLGKRLSNASEILKDSASFERRFQKTLSSGRTKVDKFEKCLREKDSYSRCQHLLNN